MTHDDNDNDNHKKEPNKSPDEKEKKKRGFAVVNDENGEPTWEEIHDSSSFEEEIEEEE